MFARFNPTMVRLLPLAGYGDFVPLLLFQSHNGAIAARSVRRLNLRTAGFQSHNGAIAAVARRYDCYPCSEVSIPQWCDCCHQPTGATLCNATSFNPTMVRLLPLAELTARAVIGGFNPTMVRLLLILKMAYPTKGGNVSIPQWCDCCK